jgi:Family of unknown function (DUF6499)
MNDRDWRSGAAYDGLNEVSLKGLAWEYLRRNPDYVADYERLAGAAGNSETSVEILKPRGLRFRCRPGSPGIGRACFLGSDLNSGHRSDRALAATRRDDDSRTALATGAG